MNCSFSAIDERLTLEENRSSATRGLTTVISGCKFATALTLVTFTTALRPHHQLQNISWFRATDLASETL